ncbi:MAG: hypothetical protein GWO08_17425, partial [Gammaproteobacteria bacterium]|nr:hypothetical protein [Gammaproteobacteria bacterium]
EPCEKLPSNLTAEEIALFEDLRQGSHQGTRLEQERLAPDYIENQLK